MKDKILIKKILNAKTIEEKEKICEKVSKYIEELEAVDSEVCYYVLKMINEHNKKHKKALANSLDIILMHCASIESMYSPLYLEKDNAWDYVKKMIDEDIKINLHLTDTTLNFLLNTEYKQLKNLKIKIDTSLNNTFNSHTAFTDFFLFLQLFLHSVFF